MLHIFSWWLTFIVDVMFEFEQASNVSENSTMTTICVTLNSPESIEMDISVTISLSRSRSIFATEGNVS